MKIIIVALSLLGAMLAQETPEVMASRRDYYAVQYTGLAETFLSNATIFGPNMRTLCSYVANYERLSWVMNHIQTKTTLTLNGMTAQSVDKLREDLFATPLISNLGEYLAQKDGCVCKFKTPTLLNPDEQPQTQDLSSKTSMVEYFEAILKRYPELKKQRDVDLLNAVWKEGAIEDRALILRTCEVGLEYDKPKPCYLLNRAIERGVSPEQMGITAEHARTLGVPQ